MTTTLSLDEVEQLSDKMLRASGAAPHQAIPTAASIREAEADGIRSVGLNYLPTYCDHVACGKVVGDAVPTVAKPRSAIIAVDAMHGFAHPALLVGLDPLASATRTCGVALLSVSHSYSAGVLGWFVERVAAEGLIALMFANSSSLMAPYGGSKPFFGTNPIAWSVPRVAAPPLVADLSSSTVAWVTVLAAAADDVAIPLGWALDADGQPTTDPHVGLAGSMAPAGGHKGSAPCTSRRPPRRRPDGLQLLVRGVRLRRQRRWAARRRAGGARDRSDRDRVDVSAAGRNRVDSDDRRGRCPPPGRPPPRPPGRCRTRRSGGARRADGDAQILRRARLAVASAGLG